MKEIDFSKYEDMLDMPHPVSKNHPQMARRDRAAQFAPFAGTDRTPGSDPADGERSCQ